MKLPNFFSKPTNYTTTTQDPIPLLPCTPYCQQPKTLSFRVNDTNIFSNTVISSSNLEETTSDPIELVIKGLRSERLFFEPERTSSILEEAHNKVRASGLPSIFKESVALSMDSHDPYFDFKKSMEEMVEAHELKHSLEDLQELLCCYLRVNTKNNHGYILGAFVDLLVGLAFASTNSNVYNNNNNNNNNNDNIPCTSSSSLECPCSFSRSPSSPLSFKTTSSSSTFTSSSCECSSHPCVVVEAEEIDVSPCSSSLLH